MRTVETEEFKAVFDIFTPLRDERDKNEKAEIIDRMVDEISEEKIKEIGNDFLANLPNNLPPIEQHLKSLYEELKKLRTALADKYEMDEAVVAEVVNRFLKLYAIQFPEIENIDENLRENYAIWKSNESRRIYGTFEGQLGRYMLYIKLAKLPITEKMLKQVRGFEKTKLALRQTRNYIGEIQYGKGNNKRRNTFSEYAATERTLNLFTTEYHMGIYKDMQLSNEMIKKIGEDFWERIQETLDSVEKIVELEPKFKALKMRLAKQYQLRAEIITVAIYRYLKNPEQYEKDIEKEKSEPKEIDSEEIKNKRKIREYTSKLNRLLKIQNGFQENTEIVSGEVKKQICEEMLDIEAIDIENIKADDDVMMIVRSFINSMISDLAEKYQMSESMIRAISMEKRIMALQKIIDELKKKLEENVKSEKIPEDERREDEKKEDEKKEDEKKEEETTEETAEYWLSKNLINNVCYGDIPRARLYARFINYTLDARAIEDVMKLNGKENQTLPTAPSSSGDGR